MRSKKRLVRRLPVGDACTANWLRLAATGRPKACEESRLGGRQRPGGPIRPQTFPLLEGDRLCFDSAAPSQFVESPGGISPPGAPRTVHDPLEPHGSRCSAVALNGFASSTGSSCLQLASSQARTTQPLRSSPITGPSTLLRAAPPCAPLRYSRPRGWSRLRLVPSRHQRDEAQVLTFHTKAWSSFAPPTCRMPLGQYQGIPRADPGGRVTPRF